jgi:long-chain fatty acid transport protein
MNKQQKNIIRAALAASVIMAIPSLSHAAAFGLVEQNVSSLGNAFAGASSIAQDASTVYYNPAGMTQLSGRPFSVALHAITPSAKFSDSGSDITNGSNGGDAGGTEIAPNLYYVADISDNTKFGIGINAPFGLSTEYDENWVGRYHSVKSELTSININPSIAFTTDSPFSFGFGMNFQYVDVTLSNALDSGAICYGAAAQVAGISTTDCDNAGLSPAVATQSSAADGFSDISGDSWGIGYNFGVLFSPNDDSRVGFAYRSRVKHTLDGEADFTLPAATSAFTPIALAFQDTGAMARISLPESAALSAYQRLTNEWELLGEITYTKWSRLQEIVIEFDNTYKSASSEPLKFRNTYRYAIGANYKPDSNFTVRGGFAFDEGASPNSEFRTPRVPDHDRTWVSLGMGYKQGNMSFDAAYAHLFIDDASISRTSATGDVLRGKYELSVDIISAQYNYVF